MTVIDPSPRQAERLGPLDDLDTPEPLEALFGDPADPGNPVGHQAFVDADERGDFLPAGRKTLESFGIGAEFVPRALGGRLGQADDLARVLRTVFRHDGALALGLGAINLIASSTVWAAGGAEQRRWLASVLLDNHPTAGAITELAHGDDLSRTRLRATERDGGVVLDGRKEVINNVARAHAVTVLARTSEDPGSRSHTLFLVDPAAVPRERMRFLPRYRTSGMRGTHLGGVEFLDCPLPASAAVGGYGDAMETILRCFQVTKSVASGAALGMVDTMLRTVVDFGTQRRLYGRSVTELPYVEAELADVFTDLLICDAMTTTACRALHVLPRQTSVYAAATKYLVPEIEQHAADRLALVLGARSFLREGPHAAFQKHFRDLPVAALAHSGATVCLATIIPQLPRLARRSWFTSSAPEPALFQLGRPLPDLDFGQLEANAGPDDQIVATLLDVGQDRVTDPTLRTLCGRLVDELRILRDGWRALAPRNRTPFAGPVGFELAERYAVVLAASACLGVWWHNQDHPDPFMRDTAWVVSALDRLTVRLGHEPLPQARSAARQVFAELLGRHAEHRAFDLIGRRLH
ncbi:acyl-CoA dehydrogenase [Streptomyces durhamensis]|uniref:acyl-CoA dehydrogenase n=1 Tax=Streptomyces durhamensis TaxID=68194 RepID=UPI0004CCCA22|nr:acyl-CoA dehydrogenase [Streptomyces durhamensis]